MEGVDSLLRGYVPGPVGGWASSLLRVALTAARSGTEEADDRFGSSKPGGVDGAALAMMVSRKEKEDEGSSISSEGGGGGRELSPLEAVLPWPDLSWLLQSFLPATDIQSCRLCSRAMRSAVMHRHSLWLRWPDSSSSHHQRQQRATEGGGLLRRWLWPSSYRPSQEEEEEEDEDEGGCGGGLWGLQALLGPGHAEGSRITTLVLPREGGQWWVGSLAGGLSQGALPALTALVMTGPVPASSPHTAALLEELGRPRRWGLSRLSLALSVGEEEGGGSVCAALEALSGALEGHGGALELLALDLTHALRGGGQQGQLGPALVRVLAGKPCLAGLRYLGLVAHPSPCAWETSSSSSSSQGHGGWAEAVHQALAAYLWEARRPHLRSLVTGLHALPPTSPPASSLQPLLSLAQAWGDEQEGGGGRCPGLELCQGPLQCMLTGLPPRLAGCPAALAIQHALARAVAGPAAWGRQLRSLVLLVLPGNRLLSSFLQSVAQSSHRCPQVRHVRLELKANRQQEEAELLQPLRLVLSLPAFPGLRELEVVDEAAALDEHSLREHVQRWWATAPGDSSSSSTRGGAALVYHGSGGGREEEAGRAKTHRWTAAAASD